MSSSETVDLQNVFYGSAVAFDFSLGTSDALLAMALYRNMSVPCPVRWEGG